MSEIEIPDEAYRAARFAAHRGLGTLGERSDAAVRAAYPSIRRQVLESVVEDVARRLSTHTEAAWATLPDASRAYWLREALPVLGLPSEGEGS